ncbi:hypothetical protein GCM10023322_48280 [Rugosimonospora acidiphila]|uniref:Transthyretin/hydroxyisourate hydrolase domain-containing protein n=1 Tax=Rugosimonospora acidiphila TaxID=556531 RepID=A0ABP9S5Z9_9ACTN
MNVSARALDGMYGRSAAGVPARIERVTDGGWMPVAFGETDADGFIVDWSENKFERTAHRIIFDSDRYFAGQGVKAAYPEVSATFRIADDYDTYQIQVVLCPASYTMYFGTHG